MNEQYTSGQHIVWHDDVIVKQFISYAVGCMMGRYSIDKPGLILANQGDGVKEYEALVPNARFEIDDDGIIPLMASNTDFADNATVRFKKWLAVVLGEERLVENLNTIEAALGKSIDDFFVKDFWKYHKKMYQNRPIYWLFSSKKGAFQCIAYMHRMTHLYCRANSHKISVATHRMACAKAKRNGRKCSQPQHSRTSWT